MRCMIRTTLIFLFFFSLTTFASEPVKLSDGDKICFIGNSITHGGMYHAYLQTYCATRYPEIRLEFINCGISGDNAGGMLRRFEKDVLAHNPDYAFLMTGMNDVNHSLYAEPDADSATLSLREKALESYFVQTEKLALKLIENKIQPIFMTPSIYDQTAEMDRKNKPGVNDALAICALHIRKLAEKYDAPLVDLFACMNEINLRGQESDPTFTIVGPDRVHPGAPGHLIMAFEIIKSIFPEDEVPGIELSAKKLMVFEVLEHALPFPLEKDLKPVVKFIPWYAEYNREMLTVKKLKRGNYTLQIDEVEIGSFSSGELKSGINLSAYSNSPQYLQADSIMDLCFEYNRVQNRLRVLYMIEFRDLRDYEGDGSLADKKAYLEAKCETQKDKSWYPYMVKTTRTYFEDLPMRSDYENDLITLREKIYTKNKAHTHTYSLIRQ